MYSDNVSGHSGMFMSSVVNVWMGDNCWQLSLGGDPYLARCEF